MQIRGRLLLYTITAVENRTPHPCTLFQQKPTNKSGTQPAARVGLWPGILHHQNALVEIVDANLPYGLKYMAAENG